jgi:hypothetical protein
MAEEQLNVVAQAMNLHAPDIQTVGGMIIIAIIFIAALVIACWLVYAWISYPKKFPFVDWKAFLRRVPHKNRILPKIDYYALESEGFAGLKLVGRVKSDPTARLVPIIASELNADSQARGFPDLYNPSPGLYYTMETIDGPSNQKAYEALIKKDELIRQQGAKLKELEMIEAEFNSIQEDVLRDTKIPEFQIKLRDKTFGIPNLNPWDLKRLWDAATEEIKERKQDCEKRGKAIVNEIENMTAQAAELNEIILREGRPILKPKDNPVVAQLAIAKAQEKVRRFLLDDNRTQLALIGGIVILVVFSLVNIYLMMGSVQEIGKTNLQAAQTVQATWQQSQNKTFFCDDYCVAHKDEWSIRQITTINPVPI